MNKKLRITDQTVFKETGLMYLFFILETKNSSYWNLKYIISGKCKMFLFGFMFTFKDMWGVY